jgi:hypothetical protein
MSCAVFVTWRFWGSNAQTSGVVVHIFHVPLACRKFWSRGPKSSSTALCCSTATRDAIGPVFFTMSVFTRRTHSVCTAGRAKGVRAWPSQRAHPALPRHRPLQARFWAACPHRTRPLRVKRASNLATDKVYGSFDWPAAIERLLLEHDLASIDFEPATNTAGALSDRHFALWGMCHSEVQLLCRMVDQRFIA